VYLPRPINADRLLLTLHTVDHYVERSADDVDLELRLPSKAAIFLHPMRPIPLVCSFNARLVAKQTYSSESVDMLRWLPNIKMSKQALKVLDGMCVHSCGSVAF
jgi:hypothetical protein